MALSLVMVCGAVVPQVQIGSMCPTVAACEGGLLSCCSGHSDGDVRCCGGD
jgi:hypothetical protein